MLSKKHLFPFIAICIVMLLVAACAAQAETANTTGAPQPAAAVDSHSEEEGGEEAHGEAEEAADEHGSDAAHQEDDSHAADEHADETPHADGDGHAPAEHMAAMDMHSEGDEHSEGDGHAEGGHAEGDEHGVPAEALAVENPILATESSIAAGAATYTQFCAVCHGNEGKGDGPGAAALNPKPANFSAEHVQMLSDGGLFWFITNGVPNSAMPPWGDVLREQQRWDLVNFLRTFKRE